MNRVTLTTITLIFYFLLLSFHLFSDTTYSDVKAEPYYIKNRSITCNLVSDSLGLVALYNATDGANRNNTWDIEQPMNNWQRMKPYNANCTLSLADLSLCVNNALGQSNNGSILATITGGNAGYSVTWDNGDTGNYITNLSTGTYTVTISGGNCTLIKSAIVGFEEAPVIEWEKSYGGTNGDLAQSIAITNDGGYIIGGYSQSNDYDLTGNNGNTDAWVFKIDSSGALEWSKNFGNATPDRIYSVTQASDGNFFAVGHFGNISGDWWVAKLDAAGMLIWSQNYSGGAGTNTAISVEATENGGCVISGNWDSYSTHILKLDALGMTEWSNTYDGQFGTIHKANDGGYIIGGMFYDGNHNIYQMVKLDINGILEWQQPFTESSNIGLGQPYHARQTKDGGFILAGYTNVAQYNTDARIIKVDADGNLEWSRQYGGTNRDYARDIRPLDDGNYLVIGEINSTEGDISGSYGFSDVWLFKINYQGDLLWSQNYGATHFESGYMTMQTPDGGFILAGHSGVHSNNDISNNYGSTDAWIVKLNAPVIEQAPITFIVGETCGTVSNLINIPISVENFNNINGFQYSIHVDPEFATINSVSDFGLYNWSIDDFTINAMTGTITLIWEASDVSAGESVADNTVIFNINVSIIGNSGMATPVFIDGNPTPVAVAQNLEEVIPSLEEGEFCVVENINSLLNIESDTICQGVTTELHFQLSGGFPPYTITYNDGISDIILTDINSEYTVAVSPNVTTTYTLLSIEDSEGIIANFNQSETIIVNNPLNPGISSSIQFCTTDTLNLFEILGGNPDIGGTWTVDNPNGVNIDNPEEVLFTSTTGLYIFTYTIGGNGCPMQSSTVEVQLMNCETLIDDFGGEYFTYQMIIKLTNPNAIALNNISGFQHAVLLDESPCGKLQLWEIIDNIILPDGTVAVSIEEKIKATKSKAEVEEGGKNYMVNILENQNKSWTHNYLKKNKTGFKNTVNFPSNANDVVKVAIIDTGISDCFTDYLSENTSCQIGAYGYNFIEKNTDIRDFHGHGTKLASRVINAYQDETSLEDEYHEELLGRVSLNIAKVYDGSSGTLWDVSQGLEYSIEERVDIALCSFGYYGEKSSILECLIKDMRNACILVVTSAGNDTINTDRSPHFPSNYALSSALDNVVSVAAVNKNDGNIADYSNYGGTSAHIGYIGNKRKIGLNCTLERESEIGVGTSYAAAGFAGLLAVLKHNYSSASYKDICTAFFNSVIEDSNLQVQTKGVASLDAASEELHQMLSQERVEDCEDCYCGTCDDLNIPSIEVFPYATYLTNQVIKSRATIVEMGNITFKAGETIDLQSGFEVQLGAEFLAIIDNCEETINLETPNETTHLEEEETTEKSITPKIKPNLTEKKDNAINISPNPFQNTTQIQYHTDTTDEIYIFVSDLTGHKIKLVNGEMRLPGTYHLEFDGTDLAAGLYFVIYRLGNEIQTKKMTIIKN